MLLYKVTQQLVHELKKCFFENLVINLERFFEGRIALYLYHKQGMALYLYHMRDSAIYCMHASSGVASPTI